MKKYSLIFLVFFLVSFCSFAQLKTPKQPVQIPPKSKTSPIITPKKDVNHTNATIKILTNYNCHFYVDGEIKGQITGGELLKIYLAPGDYQFKAISVDNQADYVKYTYSISKDEINSQKIFEIDLLSVVNTRIANERIELEKQNELNRKAEAKRNCFQCKGAGVYKALVDCNQCVDGYNVKDCYMCEGVGKYTCDKCSGSGENFGVAMVNAFNKGLTGKDSEKVACGLCNGSGKSKCKTCGGKGELKESCYYCNSTGKKSQNAKCNLHD
jgi:hypothetical protein